LGVHPVGFASKSTLNDLHISGDPPADYGKIAEAAGAWAKKVENVNDLENSLKEAVKVVQGGQSAVLDVFIKQ
jgi:thiamine pyrophosphate-dependent acetolactate synthase large subunit-like protein